MPRVKVIVDYSSNRYTDSEFSVKTATIAQNLSTSPDFATLAEIGATIKTKSDSFSSVLARMPEGNKQLTLEKNQIRFDLENLLGTTALKVQDLSNGDERMILSAGFDVKRKPAPVGLLERPTGVEANPGRNRGSLEISWNVVPNSYIYELEYTEAPSTETSVWLRTSNTKRKIVLENLTRGKAYVIKVAGAGSDPGRVWSDEIVSYVM